MSRCAARDRHRSTSQRGCRRDVQSGQCDERVGEHRDGSMTDSEASCGRLPDRIGGPFPRSSAGLHLRGRGVELLRALRDANGGTAARYGRPHHEREVVTVRLAIVRARPRSSVHRAADLFTAGESCSSLEQMGEWPGDLGTCSGFGLVYSSKSRAVMSHRPAAVNKTAALSTELRGAQAHDSSPHRAAGQGAQAA
jgi:hypothetical protein